MAKFKEACVVTFVVAMAVLMVVLPRHARADDCAPREAVIASVTANHPAQMVVLDRVQTARVATWWDAQPPVSDDHFNLVILLRDSAHNVVLLVGRDDLICRVAPVPKQAIPMLFNVINGSDPT